MSNKDSEKIINAILVKLNNTTDYSKLNENNKTKYVLEMLKKNKLIYTKESQELIDIYNLQSCIDEMKEILEIIYNSNLYAANQIKLQRINKNLKNIFLNAEEFMKTLSEFKILINSIEKNYIKNIDKIKSKFLNGSLKKTRKKSDK
tara:strand:- start:18 stop:458 length:441 start_codon:yes stop_codon:yes gene_type:complete